MSIKTMAPELTGREVHPRESSGVLVWIRGRWYFERP